MTRHGGAADLSRYPRSALRSYLEQMLDVPGHTLATALGELNDEFGRRYRMNRLYEWLSGSRPVPDDVRRFCARASVQRVLLQAGVRVASDAALDQIADSLG